MLWLALWYNTQHVFSDGSILPTYRKEGNTPVCKFYIGLFTRVEAKVVTLAWMECKLIPHKNEVKSSTILMSPCTFSAYQALKSHTSFIHNNILLQLLCRFPKKPIHPNHPLMWVYSICSFTCTCDLENKWGAKQYKLFTICK